MEINWILNVTAKLLQLFFDSTLLLHNIEKIKALKMRSPNEQCMQMKTSNLLVCTQEMVRALSIV